MFKLKKQKNENLNEGIETSSANNGFSFDELDKNPKKSKYGNDLLPGESRGFFELFMIHSNTAKKWQRLSMVSLAIAAFSIVWAAKVSTGIKYIPVVIYENDIGGFTPLGIAENKQLKVNEKEILGQIYTYMKDLRSVIQDVGIEKERRTQLLLLTSEKDQEKINDIFMQQLKDAGNDTISIEITQIMPVKTSDKNAWKVQWVEKYGSSPNLAKRYEAIFNTVLKKVETNNPNEIALNPTGLQISDFTMSQIFDNSVNKNNDISN